jgi:hypothetical protein
MTSPTTVGAPRPDQRVQDEFLELLLADEQLLRAEFEALMREAWPDEPAVPALRPFRPRPPRRPARRWRSRTVLGHLPRPDIEAEARQRGPPHPERLEQTADQATRR